MPVKPTHTKHTEAELRLALSRLAPVEGLRRDDDDPVAVLSNGISELLDLRQHLEEVRAFVQAQQVKFSRK